MTKKIKIYKTKSRYPVIESRAWRVWCPTCGYTCRYLTWDEAIKTTTNHINTHARVLQEMFFTDLGVG